LVRSIEVLGESLIEMRHAPDARLLLEVSLVKLTNQTLGGDIAAIIGRLERLEAGVVRNTDATCPVAKPAPVNPATGRVQVGGKARMPQANTPTPAPAAPAEPFEPSALAQAERSGSVPPIARRPPPRGVGPVDDPLELASLDPDDLAAWVRPGDPEPTMAEVIDALRHAGIHDGIAAFNPPGTRPALEGIVVPEDFVLPPGYVRHHQVTDEGELIEPILMFSPDHEFVDARGRPIVLPEDGVVPPELAPPGLPIRRVRIPSP
jgi:hypothetical protein